MPIPLSVSSIKQLCINRLDIPSELSDIIKSYVFNDPYRSQIKQNKKRAMMAIQEADTNFYEIKALYCLQNEESSCGYWYWSYYEPTVPYFMQKQFQAGFCRKCGDYIRCDIILPIVNECGCGQWRCRLLLNL